MSSEDMDSLTFGAPKLIRNLMAPASAKLTINEYDYDKVCSSLPKAAYALHLLCFSTPASAAHLDTALNACT